MENSFKELLKQDKQEFEKKHQKVVRDSIQSNLTMLKFVGEVAEVYLSRVKDVMVIALSDKQKT